MPKIEDMADFNAAAFMAIDGINRFVETLDPDESGLSGETVLSVAGGL